MLYISLVMSLVLLVIGNMAVRWAKSPAAWVTLVGVGTISCPFGLAIFSPALAIQVVLMAVSLLVLLLPQRGRRLYLPLSLAAVPIAYTLPLWTALAEREELIQLQDRYPFESIEERLPVRTSLGVSAEANPIRLNKLERAIDWSGEWVNRAQTSGLRDIHEGSLTHFVNSQGFGMGRMGGFRNPRELKKPLPDRPPVPQPDYIDPASPVLAGSTDTPPSWEPAKMLQLHDSGVVDFVNPLGFGYARDRRHVAGFQSHGMTKVPSADVAWTVAHLDLVGLVVHPEPVAYVSDNLPQMAEIGAVPTRRLTPFEEDGLRSLRMGEDLYVRAGPNVGRMLGAIRATNQCLTCHGVPRGELLGAFSYVMRRK